MSKPDFKTLLLNHGEKAAAAIFGLLGLMAVSTADWSTDPRQPSQLQQYTSERKAAIEQNVWPDEDKALLEEIPDVVALAKLINTSSTDRDKFALRSFNQSPAPAREKRTSIAMLSPEEPLATAIVFPLAKPPEVEDETTESTEETKDPKDAKDSESMSEEEALEELLAKKFQLRDGAAGAFPGGGEAYPGAEGSYPGMVSTDPLSGGGAGYPGGAGGGAGYPGGGGPGAYEGGGYDAMYGGYDLEGMYGQGMMTVKKNIRVAAGVSVRMIVDLQKQRNIIRDALHLSGDYQVAQQHIQYVDLLVERRQKLDGSNQWGEWEPMSSEDLGEILEESLGIDRDVVSPAVTRNTITMPLPRRAAGVWTAEEASHPRVEDFELSAEEKALIDKFNQMVTERAEEEKLIAPVQVEQKGFSKFVQSATDIGSMYGNMAMESGGSYESSYDNMYSQYESQMGPGTKLTAEQRQLLDATKATADHRLLLVRFMDFTVERGHSYQYRTRLEMKNPNYEHPPDELEDPSLGIEPTLFSDWSQPTPDVYVPVAHRTYLTGVSARGGEQENVDLTVYTDTTETGLPVMGDVRVLMGLPISGKQNLEVVDLTSNVLETREITLSSDEVVAAADRTDRQTTSDHPDLKPILDRLDRGAKLIPDQICVIDSNGLLKMRVVGDQASQEKQDRLEADFILKQYEVWKPKTASAANSFFGAEGGAGSYEGGGYGLGMEAGSSAYGGYYGGGGEAETGRRQSSRAMRRDRRSGKTPPPGLGAGGFE